MKRSIRKTAIATLLAATLAGPALAEQYVCETEQTTGFEYNTIIMNEWAQMRWVLRRRWVEEIPPVEMVRDYLDMSLAHYGARK